MTGFELSSQKLSFSLSLGLATQEDSTRYTTLTLQHYYSCTMTL